MNNFYKFICVFFVLFLIIIFIKESPDIRKYVTNNLSKVNESDKNLNENKDISNIALGVTNIINSDSLTDVAVDIERVEVYDEMTIEELSLKLNRYLKDKGVLANYGEYIAVQSLALGVDPYVAVAIMMHETGCNATCSRLVINKNNVGGMRGRSGNWQSFATLEAGIDGFLSNLSRNYYKKGLDTPEKMQNKYAGGSTTWAGKVRKYISKIESV